MGGCAPPTTPRRTLTPNLSRCTGRGGSRTIGVRCRGVMNLEEEREVGFVEAGGAADRHGAGGVAVIGLGEADEFVFFRVAEVVPVLGGQLKGDFGGGCAGVG